MFNISKKRVPLYKLKVLNLEWSKNLIKEPDFTTAPNLETLVLEGCTRLVYVHPSVGDLKRLKLLNIRGCKSLRSFPTKIGMESLEKLILSSCSNLESFSEIDGKMECLLELPLDGTGIKEIPFSIGNLSSLVLLNLKDCRNLMSLPGSIGGCKSVKILNLSGCYKVEKLPENLQQVELLEELDLSETSMRKPPPFSFQFKNLKVLSFNGSKGLSSLTRLNLKDCNLCEGDIPGDISRLSSLEILDLGGNNFISIPSYSSFQA
ncbi:hypothetical protein GOBAR_DD26872 [Gossypium barbadense]|nr:hypothetical protein GOBAR_DD26872 [Gossypium barbadense]